MVAGFQPGTVVYHPGGGLSDHYAVHVIQLWAFKKLSSPVPVMTTRMPIVGERLQKVTASIPTPDPMEMVRGFKLAVSQELGASSMGYKEAAWAMLAGVHNAAVWMGRNDRLIGYGMGMAYRLCHTACMGKST